MKHLQLFLEMYDLIFFCYEELHPDADLGSDLWAPPACTSLSSVAPCRSGIACKKLISLKFTEFREYHQQTVHKL